MTIARRAVALRGWLLSLLLILCASRAVATEDWRIESLDGSARIFAHGEWAKAQSGGAAPVNAIVQTGDETRMRVKRGSQSLLLGSHAKIRIDEAAGPIIRALEGGVGVEVEPIGDAPFLVMSTYVSIAASDAAVFGVLLEPYGASIGVRSGEVAVTDLLTHEEVLLRQGQILRVHNDGKLVPQPAKGDEPAISVFWGEPLAVSGLDFTRTAAFRLDGQRARRTMGPFKMGAGAWDQPYDATEPWDDSFQWTEIENGALRLKPISRVIYNLRLPEAYEFWFLTGVACLFIGAAAAAVMEETGLTMGGGALLVALAIVAAILVRDLFFRSGANIVIEPYLSVGMMIAAATATLVTGAYAKLQARA